MKFRFSTAVFAAIVAMSICQVSASANPNKKRDVDGIVNPYVSDVDTDAPGEINSFFLTTGRLPLSVQSIAEGETPLVQGGAQFTNLVGQPFNSFSVDYSGPMNTTNGPFLAVVYVTYNLHNHTNTSTRVTIPFTAAKNNGPTGGGFNRLLFIPAHLGIQPGAHIQQMGVFVAADENTNFGPCLMDAFTLNGNVMNKNMTTADLSPNFPF